MDKPSARSCWAMTWRRPSGRSLSFPPRMHRPGTREAAAPVLPSAHSPSHQDLGSLVRVGALESNPGDGCSDRRHGQSPHAWQRPVARVLLGPRGEAQGVVLQDGTEVKSKLVLSNASAQLTFLQLVPPEQLPEEFLQHVAQLDTRSPVTKINVAVDRLPSFLAAPNSGDGRPLRHHQCSIHLNCEDTCILHRAFQEASSGEPSARPMIELCVPSALDPTLAPPGCHVVSLFTQYTPYTLAGGRPWDEQEQNAYADRVFDWVEAYAPGFKASVVGRDILTPPALEKIFGLPGGNIFHSAMSLDQLYFARPVPSYSGYRSPVPGLYLCGSGAHPGGGVMGAAGRNAASVALEDFKRRTGLAQGKGWWLS